MKNTKKFAPMVKMRVFEEVVSGRKLTDIINSDHENIKQDGQRMYVLMGANIASEVAAEQFCETTIGSKVLQSGLLFKELLQTPKFRVTVVEDSDTVELCGALKKGFCDSFCCGDNTKATVIRLGLMEMIAFARTFLESCGVTDLISSCYGG
ncbi:Glycerol-3-phosphate dehydrogenase 1-like protein [Microtus ochrogaster]|uniref:Glycerol-3-phosphate dehydrogenase [NAD(+)] n=1 Tax=Microtus ochrogaster TaxID=79684 RepID=A0A8J6L0N0_MICOH|nr:Glycerol-3-phosphate dehydrogenase 1-like protein [Microtus ochrogaster]